MSWLRIEGRMPQNRKVAPLSDAAFRLHVTVMSWCVEEESDGKVPTNIPATMTAAPRGKALQRLVTELTDAGLWDTADGDGYIVHDFLQYNPSAAHSKAVREAKSSAGAAGGRAKASGGHSKNLAGASHGAKQTPGEPEANGQHDAKQNSSPTPTPTPTPTPEDPDPPQARVHARPRDPLRDSLTSEADELPAGWQPNADNRALAVKLGLNADDELGEYSAHRRRESYRCGNWDADFEVWIRRSKRFARERGDRATTGGKGSGGPSQDWPTDADLSLREAIRGGAHGPTLKAKLEAGQLDAALAKRLVRERQAERKDAHAGQLGALLGSVGRPLPQ